MVPDLCHVSCASLHPLVHVGPLCFAAPEQCWDHGVLPALWSAGRQGCWSWGEAGRGQGFISKRAPARAATGQHGANAWGQPAGLHDVLCSGEAGGASPSGCVVNAAGPCPAKLCCGRCRRHEEGVRSGGETRLQQRLVHPGLGRVAVTAATSGVQRGACVQQREGKSPSPR